MIYNMLDIYSNPSEFDRLLYHDGYLIYKISNQINHKCYIGDTFINLRLRLFDHPWGAHFSRYENPDDHGHLYNSMRKYGLENFNIEIVYSGNYEPELEQSFIEKYDSFNNGL